MCSADVPYPDLMLCIGHQHEQHQEQTDIAGQQLAATLKLVIQLIKFKFGLSATDSVLLATYLPSEVRS